LRAKVTDRLRQAMRVLTSFEVTLPGDIRFKLGVDALAGHADSGDLADDLRDVLVSVGEAAAEAGVGFALVLDELHNLPAGEYEALIIALHRAIATGLGNRGAAIVSASIMEASAPSVGPQAPTARAHPVP
jgi:hypothetical protein